MTQRNLKNSKEKKKLTLLSKELLAADFSTVTTGEKRQWNEMLKERDFKNEGELDSFRQKPHNFSPVEPALKETLNGIFFRQK